MAEAVFFDENCENCALLAADDSCGNQESVYFGRPVVYRAGEEVVQTAWCECWTAVVLSDV